jgi:hypothetical protein
MLARMLNNPKARRRAALVQYARRVTNPLTVDPMPCRMRDRGPLLPPRRLAAALRDLEDYLRLRGWKDDADQEEHQQIVDHVKTLRRVAGTN